MIKAEEKIQKAIIEKYLEYQARFPFFTFLYSNRNENNQGGIKGILKGKIYKEMGRVAGIPDLTLLYGKGKVAFLEVKTLKSCLKKDGTFTKSKGLSHEQINIHNMLTTNGFIVEVIYNVESFEQFLCKIILLER